MVKANKIAVWKIGHQYIENYEDAEREVRRLAIIELLEESGGVTEPFQLDGSYDQVASFISDHWDALEKKVKEALAGS